MEERSIVVYQHRMTEPITVLLVDNEPGFAELAATMLEREDELFTVRTATSADEALAALDEERTDCIVSDYEMPTMTGLELLEAVRERDPERPFILFTGKGSEEIASEAISSGVTQYLQKKPGRDRYTLLANQIANAVSQYRTETELRESERRYERTLATLHETTRDLMRASTKDDIYQAAVDTASEILEVSTASAYRFEPTAGRLEYAASTSESHEVSDPGASFEREGGLVWTVFSEGETVYFEDVRSEVDGHNPATLSRSEVVVPLGTHGVLLAGSETVDGFDEMMIELFSILAANAEAALDRAEREQLLRKHDRTLTRQNEELMRLNHTNQIVREINRGVAQASTRQEIETTVCDNLTGTDRYLFAWIASSDEESPTPTEWSGVDATYIDRIREDDSESPELRVVEEAIDHEEVRIVQNVLDDDGWERRRKEALTYGFQTVLAVPLVDAERRYGAVVVHAPQVDVISDGERQVLEELGETIGHAIRSAERTRAMVTDSRLELELECSDSRLLLNRVASNGGESVSLEGVIDRNDGTIVLFVSVTAPSIEVLRRLSERWASIETVSVISNAEDVALLEITGNSTPFFDILRAYDVQVVRATTTGGATKITINASQRVETRALIESLRERYPETALSARREARPTVPTGSLDAQLEDRLTSRQFEALKTAHYSGFFEWPRESTGEELAAALDISAPTYHYHLRAAERKLVRLVFDTHSI